MGNTLSFNDPDTQVSLEGKNVEPVYVIDPLTNKAVGSISVPFTTQEQIRALINNGQGFTAITGKLTAPSAITGGLSVFNPNNSGKTLVIYAIKYMIGNNCFNQVNYTTSDPALGSPVMPINMKAGNGTTSVATCSYANTTLTPAGTIADMSGSASNVQTQVLTGNAYYMVPANNGICFYTNLSAANTWFVSISWLEI